MRGKALLVVACLLVAGCASSGDGGSSPDDDAPTADPDAPVLAAPADWTVGDHWTYGISGSAVQQREATFVVADATATDYLVATDDRGIAFFDARDDTTEISYLGKQSRATRAGSQGENRVQYFDWPLEANTTWTTTWDGAERTVRVLDVGPARAELISRGPDGALHARYTYDAEAGWFGEARFFANGTETFAMELESSGSNFSGSYVTAELTTVLDVNWTGSDGGSWNGTVDAADDDFWYEVRYAAEGPGDVGLGYNYLSGTEPGGDSIVQATCPCEPTTVQGTVAATAGNWTWQGGITSTAAVQDQQGYLDAHVLLRDFVEHTV